MAETAAQWPNGNPGTKPNAIPFAPTHANPSAVDHAAVEPVAKQRGGKDMSQLDAPVVSMHPTSEQQPKRSKNNGKVINKANFKLDHYLPEIGHVEFDYPFEKLELGQGLFIQVETTTDELMAKLYKQVDQYRKQNSEIERDGDGDDVMEDVAINKKKRNDDGTVQLDGDKPRLGIKSGFRPKLIGPNFVVKAVVKGDWISENNTAEHDGALVIRLG